MKCPKCGGSLTPTMASCPKCKVVFTDPTADTRGEAEVFASSATDRASNSRVRLIAVLLAIIITSIATSAYLTRKTWPSPGEHRTRVRQWTHELYDRVAEQIADQHPRHVVVYTDNPNNVDIVFPDGSAVDMRLVDRPPALKAGDIKAMSSSSLLIVTSFSEAHVLEAGVDYYHDVATPEQHWAVSKELSGYALYFGPIMALFTPLLLGFVAIGVYVNIRSTKQENAQWQDALVRAKSLLESHELAVEAYECATQGAFADAARLAAEACAKAPNEARAHRFWTTIGNGAVPTLIESHEPESLRLIGTPFGYSIPAERSSITLGRNRSADVVIRDSSDDYRTLRISRLHVTLHRCWGAHVLVDDSRHGTKLNHRIAPRGVPVLLRDRDKICLANALLLEFRIGGELRESARKIPPREIEVTCLVDGTKSKKVSLFASVGDWTTADDSH